MRSLFPPLFAGKNNTLEFSLEPFHSLFVSNSVLPTHGAGSPLAITYSVACKKKNLVKTEGFKNTFGLESRKMKMKNEKMKNFYSAKQRITKIHKIK